MPPLPEGPDAAPPAANGSSPPRILAVANQKGGVGKTTTAINLATALAATGKQVVVVDLDPQGNLSTGLGLAAEARRIGTYDLLTGAAPLTEVLADTLVPGLRVAASTLDLLGAEIELIDLPRREHRLADALAETRISTGLKVDYVLIDCPPALGLLTLNALVAADAVLVPLQCEFFALEGLSHLVRTVERVRKSLNQKLSIEGVVLTMFDRRNNLSDQVAADVREFFGDKVFETVIPRNVKVSEAPSHGKPVLLYDLRSAGAEAYVRLAGEMLRRQGAVSAEARP